MIVFGCRLCCPRRLVTNRPLKTGRDSVVGSEIQIFATALKTPDNKATTIPNAGITGGNITDCSATLRAARLVPQPRAHQVDVQAQIVQFVTV